jgi:hypothetical protein
MGTLLDQFQDAVNKMHNTSAQPPVQYNPTLAPLQQQQQLPQFSSTTPQIPPLIAPTKASKSKNWIIIVGIVVLFVIASVGISLVLKRKKKGNGKKKKGGKKKKLEEDEDDDDDNDLRPKIHGDIPVSRQQQQPQPQPLPLPPQRIPTLPPVNDPRYSDGGSLRGGAMPINSRGADVSQLQQPLQQQPPATSGGGGGGGGSDPNFTKL